MAALTLGTTGTGEIGKAVDVWGSAGNIVEVAPLKLDLAAVTLGMTGRSGGGNEADARGSGGNSKVSDVRGSEGNVVGMKPPPSAVLPNASPARATDVLVES